MIIFSIRVSIHENYVNKSLKLAYGNFVISSSFSKPVGSLFSNETQISFTFTFIFFKKCSLQVLIELTTLE